MSKLKAYSVKEQPDADWQIIVVAKNAQEAKVRGYDYIRSEFNIDAVYTDIRVKLARKYLPASLQYERIYTWCCRNPFMCELWDVDEKEWCEYCDHLEDRKGDNDDKQRPVPTI